MHLIRYIPMIALATIAISAHGKTPRDVDDLVDIRASSGERELEDRGYRMRKTTKIRDDSIGYWWNSRESQCIAATTSDGRFSSIVEQPEVMCGNDDTADRGYDRYDDRDRDDGWEIADSGMGLREDPDKDADYVVRGLRSGDRVRMLECENHHGNSWCRVDYRGDVGWIGEQRLRRTSGRDYDDYDDDRYDDRDDDWEIADNGVGLREQPDKDADYVVRELRKGDRVRMLKCEKHHGNDWCRVEYRNDVGWIGEDRLRRQ